VIETIRRLVETYGPSGNEDSVRATIRQEIESLADEIRVDALGNLIAAVEGDGTGRRILVAAHMDEIGIIVMHVDGNGFIRFDPVGDVDPGVCVGNRVRFANGTVGVIGLEEKRGNPGALPEFNRLYVDVGATDAETCPVGVGDIAAFERSLVTQGDRWIAKSMDDRVGCSILVEAMRRIKAKARRLPHSTFFVFSAQEQVGCRGATTAAYALQPDIGIAVDLTRAGDTPKPSPMSISLGKGPAINVRDSDMISHPGLVRLMVKRAEAAGLPYQLEVRAKGTTGASAIQLTRAGVIVGSISIPCRYCHTVSETVDVNDVRNATALLVACLEDPLDMC